MILNIQADLDYDVAPLTSALLQIEAAGQYDQGLLEASIDVKDPSVFQRVPAEDGVGERIWLALSDRLICRYRAHIEISRPMFDLAALRQDALHSLPGEAFKYLMGSRYVPTEKFQNLVAADFGNLAGGARIAAMRDWVEGHFTYAPGSSDQETSAVDSYVERQGICRDYAHVMIALARASQIPARMVSCYSPDVTPQDFHAVAEVWLEGAWRLVDATGMAQADSIARIGVGRDAADISFMTLYGAAAMNTQVVNVTRAD